MKVHRISWKLDELLKGYEAKYTMGAVSPPPVW